VSERAKLNCPRCGRGRLVATTSVAYKMSQGQQTISAKCWQWCRTCKLLHSIGQHRDAIRRREEKVMDRRMRGL
jgi:hypothetical protein